MRRVLALLLLTLVPAPAIAQVQYRATDVPIVTADNESWYLNRESIQFAGDIYDRAGAAVFFNGNTMVRSGHVNGVPLYTDTTLEPFSVVYVPLTRGLMQPYERPRQGTLAGTTGSRAPSFPVSINATSTPLPQAATPPSAPPVPIGAVGVYAPERTMPAAGTSWPSPVGTGAFGAAVPSVSQASRNRQTVATADRPQTNDGLWIPYLGEKWISAGRAVPLTEDSFRVIGRYEGFPVFARRDRGEQIIYLPTREGVVAPYRLKQ
jgi:hypothetical protein